MKDIDFLEHGGGNFFIRLNGELIAMPDPRALHYQIVLTCLTLKHAPGTPPGIPEWQRSLVFDRWAAAWDLPDARNAQRLAYLVDHYRAAISNDLRVHAGVDLGELWRGRRWTLLLDLIDRLPGTSWYASSVAMDEEHARMMAEAIAARQAAGEDTKPVGPSLTSWTPEVAAITRLIDVTKGVQHAIIAVNAGKKAPEPPKPEPRPITPLERALKRADFERRKAAHERLVARVLRKKRPPESPVH